MERDVDEFRLVNPRRKGMSPFHTGKLAVCNAALGTLGPSGDGTPVAKGTWGRGHSDDHLTNGASF